MHLAIACNAGQHKNTYLPCARRTHRLRRGRQSRTGGHHIIDEKHAAPAETLRPARMRLYRARKVAEPLVLPHSVLYPGPAYPHERVGHVVHGGEAAKRPGQNRRLIEPSADQPPRVRRNRDGQHSFADERSAGPRHPLRGWHREVEPVAMLQRQHQPAGVVAIGQCRPSPIPGPRELKTLIAERRILLRFPDEWRAAGVAGKPAQEGRPLPTCSAEGTHILDHRVAGHALGRIEHLQDALHSDPSLLICRTMSTPPTLTDRTALALRRRRAASVGRDALFLHALAADVLEERLDEVNRTFSDAAVVTGHPEFWAERFPGAAMVADEDTLALEEGRHDLVVHAMALHWANDPVGQLIQARRALRPDGLLLCVTFGGRTLSELRAALAEAEASVAGGLSPRVLPMGEIRDLGALLQRAGLALPVADNLTQRVDYESPWSLFRDLRAMGETNALADRHRTPMSRKLLEEALRVYATAFPAEDGRVRATFELVFLTGWAPSTTQQTPLRPGSARVRLAEALGTHEIPAGDAVGVPKD